MIAEWISTKRPLWVDFQRIPLYYELLSTFPSENYCETLCVSGGKVCLLCTMCCSVFQCVAMCCRVCVLQRAAVCCSVLHCAAVCCSVLQTAAGCCSVWQCAAVCLCNTSRCRTTCANHAHVYESRHMWMSHVTCEWVTSQVNESRHM